MDSTEEVKKQDHFWENLSGLVILAVVLGQFLYDFRSVKLMGPIVKALYTFRMPALIFVAGFYSRSKEAKSPLSLLKLGAAYFLFNSIAALIDIGSHPNFSMLTPYYSFWVIPAVIVWRLAVLTMEKRPNSLAYIMAAAILVGFWPDASNVMAVRWIFGYFPFFMLGYLLWDTQVEVLKAFIRKNRVKWILICTALFCGMLFFFQKKTGITFNALQMIKYGSLKDVLRRLQIYVLGCTAIALILGLAPEKEIPLLSKAGKNAVPVFLVFHFFAVFYTFLIKTYLRSMRNVFFLLPTALVCTAAIVILFSQDFIAKPLDGCFTTGAETVLNIKSTGKRKFWKAAYLLLAIMLAVSPLLKFTNNIARQEQIKAEKAAQAAAEAKKKKNNQKKKNTAATTAPTETEATAAAAVDTLTAETQPETTAAAESTEAPSAAADPTETAVSETTLTAAAGETAPQANADTPSPQP